MEFDSVKREIFKTQLILLFIISLLLMFGFNVTRQWLQFAEHDGMFTIIRGWDGFSWFSWMLAAPGILRLIRSYPLVPNRFGQNLGHILLGSLGLYVAVIHVRYFLHALPDLWWGGGELSLLFDLETYSYNTYAMLPIDLLSYCGFFAVTFSVNYYREHHRSREESIQLKLKAAQIQAELTLAELAVLRVQLHPHFIFNSLNALATLIRQGKNDYAVDVVARLSVLLRLAIDRTNELEITVAQEIDFIRSYLEIEQLRFADKLDVEIDVDPATMDALVPNIVLQPLVENAIKHGISLRTTPGFLRVAVKAVGNRLQVEITNDGPEDKQSINSESEVRRSGIGLANTHGQLQKLYGTDYVLNFAYPNGVQTIVTLDLPLHRLPASNKNEIQDPHPRGG